MSRRIIRVCMAFGIVVLAVTTVVLAQEADLRTSVAGPDPIVAGETAHIEVTYANDGPNDSADTYVDLYIPFGAPAGWNELTQDQFDALQNSAALFDDEGNPVSTTDDPLGNWPLLFIDDTYCYHLKFQVQGADFVSGSATPVDGLTAGASSTWTFDLPIPMEGLKIGQWMINDGPTAGTVFRPGTTTNNILIDAATDHRFGTGAACDSFATDCEAVSDCLGQRLWEITEPITAEMVIVDDGGVQGDPTLLCGPPLNDVAGKIAVVRRGTCDFQDKFLYAQQAGAAAIFMVNDGRCSSLPGSDRCIIFMDAADLGPLVSMPGILVSQVDGAPILNALEDGATLTSTFGLMPSDSITIDSTAFHSAAENDPDDANTDGLYRPAVEPAGPSTFVSFIPAAAAAAGAQGAFFQTDLDINNKGAGDASVTFGWLPRGADNSDFVMSDPITLAAGQSMQYENVLNAVFGLDPDVVGGIVMITDSPDVIGMSRTYNVPGGKVAGTFGQALPAVPSGNFIMTGERQRIIFMSENDDIRANVGCINGLDNSLRINIELFNAEGTSLEVKTMDLGPWSNNQINRVFRDYSPVNGYVDVWTDSADSAFYCYGSVLDNETSDPTTVLPQVPSDTMTFIPAAAVAAGAQGAFFQTDVDLNNSGSETVEYNFQWLPRGADNSNPAESDTFILGPGMGVRYENVLTEVFGLEPNSIGAIGLSASTMDLLAMTRTYNIPGAKVAGTFGQALPGVPMNQMITTGVTKRIIFMNENDDTRANLGCVNGTAGSIRITVAMYNADGDNLETKFMDLGPYSNNQLNRVFQSYAPVNGYVDVSTTTANASFYCYGSVLDNLTSDPTTVLPQ